MNIFNSKNSSLPFSALKELPKQVVFYLLLYQAEATILLSFPVTYSLMNASVLDYLTLGLTVTAELWSNQRTR